MFISVLECKKVGKFNHGTVTPPSASNTQSKVNAVVSFGCISGYKLSGKLFDVLTYLHTHLYTLIARKFPSSKI